MEDSNNILSLRVEFLKLYKSVTLKSVFKVSQHENRVLHQFTDKNKIVKMMQFVLYHVWDLKYFYYSFF